MSATTPTPESRSYGEAIRDGFEWLMQNHPNVFAIGQGLWSPWYVGNSMTGLDTQFGRHRVMDTPVSEAACTGAAIGAALCGYRPIVIHPRMDFMLLAIDQVVNSAAKMLYMSGGQFPMPMVFRGPSGAALQLSAQHSQAWESWLMHIPGLKVVSPGTPYDAKGLLKSAVRDDNPVVVLEGEMLYNTKGEVPEQEYLIPLGQAELKREGDQEERKAHVPAILTNAVG